MNDLVSEYQQYQDATAEDEEEMGEEEMEWTLLWPWLNLNPYIKSFPNPTHSYLSSMSLPYHDG
jgi:hypothetical protein